MDSGQPEGAETSAEEAAHAAEGRAHDATAAASATACRWGNNNGRKWKGGRGPSSSVNFVTAHDGFTLRDLVSYDHKQMYRAVIADNLRPEMMP